MRCFSRAVVLLVGIVILMPVWGQGTARTGSAWEALLTREPGAADDPAVGARERLILHVLTPDQAQAWRQGATEENLRLATGETLEAYLETRLSPPAGMYIGLPVPCRLFAASEVETGAVYGVRVRGDDLALQGGAAEGCGVPEEATAVVLRVEVQGWGGGRVKLWPPDGPEPAESVAQVAETADTARETVVLTLNRGLGEADLFLRGAEAAVVSGEVTGYLRALRAGDGPTGGVAFYIESDSNNYFGTGAGGPGGINNSFFGVGAGDVNTGSYNSFFGAFAGQYNTGSDNAFFGMGSGASNTTGGLNSFFGRGAGISNTGGSANSFSGWAAGANSTTGGNNSFFGSLAGLSNTTESNNTYLGASTNGVAGITNATALGYQAQVSQSHSLVLGSIAGVNNAITTVNVGIGTPVPAYRLDVVGGAARIQTAGTAASVIVDRTDGKMMAYTAGTAGGALAFDKTGNLFFIPETVDNMLALRNRSTVAMTITGGTRRVGIGTTSPAQVLHVVGNIYATGTITQGSSRVLKTDIAALNAAQAQMVLAGLTPVTYRYQADEQGDQQVGFIAEDVPDLVATADRMGVNPMDVAAVLTKVVQEQQRRLEEQAATIRALQSQVGILEALIRRPDVP